MTEASAHFSYEIAVGRLKGLLAGDFPEAWPGETWYLLGAVWGAGGLI